MKWVIIFALIGASVSWWVTNMVPHQTQAESEAWWSAHGISKPQN